jgi:hypothetical protein
MNFYMNIFPSKYYITNLLAAISITSALLTGVQASASEIVPVKNTDSFTYSGGVLTDTTNGDTFNLTLERTTNVLSAAPYDLTKTFWYGDSGLSSTVARLLGTSSPTNLVVSQGSGTYSYGPFVAYSSTQSCSSVLYREFSGYQQTVPSVCGNQPATFFGNVSSTVGPNFYYVAIQSQSGPVTTGTGIPEPDNIVGTLFGGLLVAGIVTKRKLSQSQKSD